ncbi:MAG TPA: extensin family protein [Hyphomicrobiaceae bacterium]|nr:extensin family protein [Hyphomicrobiaceae bacterium]
MFWLGLLLSAFAVSCAYANESGEAMRFVPQSDLVRSIDPARIEVPVRASVQAPAKPFVARRTPAKGVPTSWPTTLTEIRERKKAAASGRRDAWPLSEVKAARQRCNAILKRIAAVAVEEEPIKEGACGDPAPIRLISIGRKPEVVISPPALVNCEMAEAMHKWIQTELQPLARRHLGGPIIKIVKMSDYSCRNAYGRARGRLSEHGRVNAIDIAGFMTTKGDTTMLLTDWGTTQRDIRRQIAAAKAKAAAAEKRRLAAEQRGQANERAALRQGTYSDQGVRSADGGAASLPPTALGLTSGAPGGGVAQSSMVDGIGRITVSIPGGNDSGTTGTSLDMPPSRLGGPRPTKTKKSIVVLANAGRSSAVNEIRKQRFLRGAHDSACKIFGTVLGPEANNAHRNHFHLDMAHRDTGAFCQ